MVRIGLTGPIGCGKSTIAGWLAARGAAVVDADEVARAVLAPGEPALAEVLARFGATVAAPDGEVDRAALGRVVFRDEGALRDLEAIVHPRVRPRILGAIGDAEADGRPAVVVEAIKLVEGGLAELMDEIWLVTCDPPAQRDRLAPRGLARGDADARIAAQRDLVERVRPVATRVIDTSGDEPSTRAAVDAAFDEAVADAAARDAG